MFLLRNLNITSLLLFRQQILISKHYAANSNLLKFIKRDTKKRYEICSKFKSEKLRVFKGIINVVVVSLLLTVNIFHFFSLRLYC